MTGLPRKAPNTERHLATLDGDYKFAVYATAELDGHRLSAFEQELNSAEFAEDTCKLALKPDFANKPFKDVYEYHIRLRDEDTTFHPLFFIVATHSDYDVKGVLVVYLNAPDDNKVDITRCHVKEAASWGMDLDIGNMDWEDLKEAEEQEWGTNSDGPIPLKTIQHSNPETPSPASPSWQYGIWSLVEKAIYLPPSIEADHYEKPLPHRRVQMARNFATVPDGWSEIVRLHPWLCKNYAHMHRQVGILADKPDFEADDVVLLRFDWDGDVDAHDDVAITGLGLRCEKVKRVPASRAVEELDAYCREHGLPLPYPG
ncbi:uncharacterized protein K452DRAFT_305336 [Aplosporella prunicola CBS 121167]|uniref:Uncharacterized protein n=1 Tax=Aplosporella prunicola CBS 121167 TaxID=1176127 RepID=A0A6A6BSJ4_9PEZI|nr:uncharacterized protein K452DRAFT_305336 [Aplosporella prunicola CBS 121167]KAF2146403.1 hypothetical protein K452DRAFT_305336 [Aplosporella prunicola CBS 121167]